MTPPTGSYLDRPVKGGAGKGIVVLGIDDDLHHVVRVTLKHLRTHPLLLPIPQLYQHIICNKSRDTVTLHNSQSAINHLHHFASAAVTVIIGHLQVQTKLTSVSPDPNQSNYC